MTERSKMCGAMAAGTPSPSSRTSMTTDPPEPRISISTRPAPWSSEFSMRVCRICARSTGAARTASPGGPCTRMLRWAAVKAGWYSRCRPARTESREISGSCAFSPFERVRMVSTTPVSRSTWVTATAASSRTTSMSSVSPISSRRISSAVSGVRSWWEASAAKSRSSARCWASSPASRARSPATPSTSLRPTTARGSAPPPSRIAATWSWM